MKNISIFFLSGKCSDREPKKLDSPITSTLLELGAQMALPQDNVVGGGRWVVGRGWWVKKKLVGRKILSVVKLGGG